MIWLVLGLIIVLVVAVLLIWIYQEAKGIRVAAVRTLGAAQKIEERTQALWKIPELNQLLGTGYGVLGSVAHKAQAAADAVAPEAGKQ